MAKKKISELSAKNYFSFCSYIFGENSLLGPGSQDPVFLQLWNKDVLQMGLLCLVFILILLPDPQSFHELVLFNYNPYWFYRGIKTMAKAIHGV